MNGDPDPDEPKEIIGRSPGQLAWQRLKRDKTAMTAGIIVALMFIVAYGAPIIEMIYGHSPTKNNPDLLDLDSRPLGLLNGVSGDHWFGIQPNTGRDVFIRVVYGLRTSLTIAIIATIVTIALGALVGAIAGFFGRKVDAALGWITDVAMALPFLIFGLAFIPVAGTTIAGEGETPGPILVGGLLIFLFVFFGWMGSARLVRGQVISLREREFVEAARAAGAGNGHIIFKQILPNVWAPILVTFSLMVPQLVTAEAALSFLGIGIPEPTPDLGVDLGDAISVLEGDGMWFYFAVVGGTLFLMVLAFNLLGDAVRDALDPKSSR
ncbi:binding-protein-dependent transport systems inner membrane component [Stackebrandtia nassauensis DSM 44728]|uniref:Binding-protein-dependent transport systems inner membrane component n=2 Tax=Stackebrandtia TaxID=283810 RepID=D3PW21_STANL|nr:binding-protein-dependent transport systems inner membrane component [Stackebrandtia nassauensis DSM 44728]